MAAALGSQVGKMALSKMIAGQQGKGANPRHNIGMEMGKAKDMSQFSNMGGLLNAMNQMQPPQQQQRQQQVPDIDKYIKSLLGG